jgi:hypothetical protein
MVGAVCPAVPTHAMVGPGISAKRSKAIIETNYGVPTVAPHADKFDGDDAMPPGLPDALKRKILVDNPLATCARLQEDA